MNRVYRKVILSYRMMVHIYKILMVNVNIFDDLFEKFIPDYFSRSFE